MAFQTSSSLLVALGAATLLLLPACDSVVDADDTGGTTGGATSGSTSGPPATSSTTLPATSSTTVSPGTSSTGEDMTGSSSSATTTDGSSSTGEPGDCVDEDIGDAVGDEVASGTNDGQGDDFVLRYCDGGFGSSTSAGTVGPDDTGGGGEATTDPTGEGTTGVGSGTTGGSDESGDDYVVSWTPPSSGPFVIDTFDSGIDTVLSMVAPECGASRGDCNDDCDGLESGLVYEATEGETVFIVIEGYSGRQGTFVLNIAEGEGLECGGFDTDGPMTSSTSAGTSAGTSP